MNPYLPPETSLAHARAPVLEGALVPAGFARRLAAYLIDYVLVGMVSVVIGIFFGLMGDPGATASVLSFFIYVGYFAGMESSEWQATIGKRFIGIRVVNEYGMRISFWHAVGRYVAAAVNWVLFGLGYLLILFTSEKQGLHDLIVRTNVVLDDPSEVSPPTRVWVIIGVWVGLMALAGAAGIILALIFGSALNH